ncbi:glycosyltransferase [Cryptosporangium aurantiacum]|uniref:Glycosyltransferase family 28 C-terminal domain-containing protein n=1 Tax=Cryptosporangium aurantiacum TaxID=134849 RepID=A0A1M7Q2S2_9ACTN|nr:glycosyltransferase [Cryptosporangium aurantiacum]SHN24498.1 Glycosyltransferase family 28 C-terminal domain-containing protein [Cryptosporangium aurantiacum]
MSPPLRVALVAGSDPGHVFPLVGLAAALRRRGHLPMVVVAGRWLPALRRDGFVASKLHQLSPGSHPGGVFAQLHGESARLAPILAETLRPFGPDCVVADVISPFGGYAAGLLGVPWVQLVPHPLQDPSPYLPPPGSGFTPAGSGVVPAGSGVVPAGSGFTPAGSGVVPAGSGVVPAGSGLPSAGSGVVPAGSGFAPAGSGVAPGGGVGRAPRDRVLDGLRGLRDQALYRLVSRDWQRGTVEQAVARASLGLRADGRPVARLIASVPALEPPHRDWPPDAYRVGPLEWDPATISLPLPPGSSPLVFVSASTVPGGAADLLGTAIGALPGVRIACTQFEEPDGPVPDHVVAGPGRQGPAISEASVVVSGAGHGIVAKALARGVPLVVVPGAGEQAENAAKLVRAGLGLAIPPRKLTPARLAEAVRTVLDDPGFTVRARACVPSGRAQGEVAVDVLEAVVRGRTGRVA